MEQSMNMQDEIIQHIPVRAAPIQRLAPEQPTKTDKDVSNEVAMINGFALGISSTLCFLTLLFLIPEIFIFLVYLAMGLWTLWIIGFMFCIFEPFDRFIIAPINNFKGSVYLFLHRLFN